MKMAYKFDINGFYVEDILLEDADIIPKDCTGIRPQDGLYKAQFVNGAWVEGMAQNDVLTLARNLKISELNSKYQQAINGTFTSNALGVSHTYLAVQAQENYNSEVHRYLIDSTYSSTLVDTVDAGLLSHTKDQFFQVFKDGHDFVVQQRSKLDNLITQVNTATADQLSSINWA